MPEVPSSDAVHGSVLRLAQRVIARTNWPEWHVEEVPASRVHGAGVILVFASPLDRTVEEVTVTVEHSNVTDGWVIDASDREGLPLDGTAPWDSNLGDEALSVDGLEERIASLEPRIVTVLGDLRRG